MSATLSLSGFFSRRSCLILTTFIALMTENTAPTKEKTAPVPLEPPEIYSISSAERIEEDAG
nr:MAG TPA: hypothetical protein [Caudoviricetes sp.]